MSMAELSEVMKNGRELGIIASVLLGDAQCTCVRLLGLIVDTLGTENLREVVERGRDVGMVGAKPLLADAQGAPADRFCPGDVALLSKQRCKVTQRDCDVGVLGAAGRLDETQRTTE